MQNQTIRSGNLSLKDAAYNALLALAESHPINDVDPVTTDAIPRKNKVVISNPMDIRSFFGGPKPK